MIFEKLRDALHQQAKNQGAWANKKYSTPEEEIASRAAAFAAQQTLHGIAYAIDETFCK
jgi:putative aminopeptidase FrvX